MRGERESRVMMDRKSERVKQERRNERERGVRGERERGRVTTYMSTR